MSATITIVDDEIAAEMQRAQEAEGELSNRITANSEGLSAEITRATGSENELSNSISITSEGLSAEITRATGAESELSAAITATAESISVEVQKGLNGQGGYSSIYQTASQVSTIVANDAYVKRAGITIETDGIHMFASSSSQTSTVDITPSAINVKSGSALNVSSGANINVASGGKLIITSDNFTIDSNGNVTVKGNIQATSGTVGGWAIDTSSIKNGKVGLIKTSSDSEVAIFAGNTTANSAPFRVTQGGALTATNATITGDITATSGSFTGSITSTSGTIGGWTIGSNNLHAGSNTSYVSLATSGDYAIWAGAESATSAPFRVKKDGTVYSTKLITLNEQGTESTIDLRNYSLWKLNYATVKNISVSGNTLTIETTAGTTTFSKATPVLTGAWGGNKFTVSASDSSIISIVEEFSADKGTGTSALATYNVNAFNASHKAYFLVTSTRNWSIGCNVDASSVYSAGVTEGRKSATLTASGWSNGTNKVTNDYNSDKYVNVSVPSITSYNSITLSATDTGTAVSKSVTANIGDTTRSANLSINAKAVYDAGVVTGEGHFTSVSLTLQGSKYLSTATYYTSGTPVTYYQGSTGTYYQASTTLYKAGTPVTYYKGSTGSYYSAATTLYKAGTETTYYKGSTGSYYSAATTLYKKGTEATYYNGDGAYVVGRGTAHTITYSDIGKTYYPGNGTAGYLRGSTVSVTPIGDEGTKLTVNTRGDSVKVTPIGDEGTKLTVNTRGDSVTVTPIGDEGTQLTVNTRGDSVTVTPIGNAVTRYSANPNSVELYQAGSSTSSYYTKNT